jgi:hypothetical protein
MKYHGPTVSKFLSRCYISRSTVGLCNPLHLCSHFALRNVCNVPRVTTFAGENCFGLADRSVGARKE